MKMLTPFFVLLSIIGCRGTSTDTKPTEAIFDNYGFENHTNPYTNIEAIPVPAGYTRITAETGSFATWLRKIPLKKNTTVYKYNGLPKGNQSAQFAVLDITVGDKDLQQCADAVMRLRAEYLFAAKRLSEIDFIDNAGRHYRAPLSRSRQQWENYLENVFAWCGTISLEKQLKPIRDLNDIRPGDVLIKGGSPGHAMLVGDMAINKNGKKIYLLLQSYIPAQDIHIVKNPTSESLSPWYELNENEVINTPEWDFTSKMFRTW